ncbi:MAG TPA: hypothetical protein VLX92_01280 [Kofleriaceae bacterium]|nr:hypothetical protein [Kofleriaceae bacterium]
MIVIYGRRSGGKVDGRDGQYAITKFIHVYYLPLVPAGGFWVTSDGYGHTMKLSARSVIAGYARTWAPLLGIAGLVAIGGIAGAIVAVAGAGAAVATLAWTQLRDPAAQRRSDLSQLAFRTRCDARLLPDELAAGMRVDAAARWAQIAGGQSPADVARFGTDDIDRAAAAYGLLRLTALTLPPAQAAEAERDASRIADGLHDKLLRDGGPYRG